MRFAVAVVIGLSFHLAPAAGAVGTSQDDTRIEDALQVATTGNYKKARALLEAVQADCEAARVSDPCSGIDELVRTAQLWDGDTVAAARTLEKMQRAADAAVAEQGCGPLATVQMERAFMLLGQQQFAEAAKLLGLASACDNETIDRDTISHQRAFALAASGQWREAKSVLLPLYQRAEAFEHADMRHGWGMSIAWMLGEAYLALGDVPRARAALDRALRHHLEFLRTHGGDFDGAAMSSLKSGQPAFRRSIESAWLLATGEARAPKSTGLFRR